MFQSHKIQLLGKSIKSFTRQNTEIQINSVKNQDFPSENMFRSF